MMHPYIRATAGGVELLKADDPKAPGSRGGKFYQAKSGRVRYGERPEPSAPEGSQMRRDQEAGATKRVGRKGTKAIHQGEEHEFHPANGEGGHPADTDDYEYGHIRHDKGPIPAMGGGKPYLHGFRHRETGEFHTLGSAKSAELLNQRRGEQRAERKAAEEEQDRSDPNRRAEKARRADARSQAMARNRPIVR